MKRALVTCDACRGDCCTGMAIQIPTPRSAKDFADIRWYLFHERTHVYIDRDGDWIVEMDLPCAHRDPATGACAIYEQRPPVCREALHAECERNREDAAVRFRSVAAYERWLGARRRRKTRHQRRRSA